MSKLVLLHRPRPYATWWTRERVISGLRRFYREHGYTPTASVVWHQLHVHSGKGRERRYPSSYAILRRFRTFRQAWTAAGVDVNRSHEDFTPEEDWYIREAAGLLSREQIARDLKRTPLSVKTWLRYHGLHSYELHGWTPGRIERATGFTVARTIRLIDRGKLPAVRGSKCWYIQPADLTLTDTDIDWASVPRELELAARKGLYQRLVDTLANTAPSRLLAGQPYTADRQNTRWRR